MTTEQEREAFEAKFPMPADCQWCGNGYAPTEFNAWDAQAYAHRWEGWEARAALQSPEIQALRKDAGRYRWLRADNAYFPEENYMRGGQELDAAIDAAMEKRND